MPAGFQVLDSSGDVVIDVTTRLSSYYGSVEVFNGEVIKDKRIKKGYTWVMPIFNQEIFSLRGDFAVCAAPMVTVDIEDGEIRVRTVGDVATSTGGARNHYIVHYGGC